MALKHGSAGMAFPEASHAFGGKVHQTNDSLKQRVICYLGPAIGGKAIPALPI